MDRTPAGPELLSDRDDLRDAQARLALLHPGSRDYVLMAEVVARLSEDADRAIRRRVRRAALRDAAALSQCQAGRYRSPYDGPLRPEYQTFLAAYVTALGGSLEDGPTGLRAVFSGRAITVRFSAAEPPAEIAPDRPEHHQHADVALRAAFVEGAEARSRSDRGRALTGQELERVLERYRGDAEAE